jgi:hypothetical protein
MKRIITTALLLLVCVQDAERERRRRAARKGFSLLLLVLVSPYCSVRRVARNMPLLLLVYALQQFPRLQNNRKLLFSALML